MVKDARVVWQEARFGRNQRNIKRRSSIMTVTMKISRTARLGLLLLGLVALAVGLMAVAGFSGGPGTALAAPEDNGAAAPGAYDGPSKGGEVPIDGPWLEFGFGAAGVPATGCSRCRRPARPRDAV